MSVLVTEVDDDDCDEGAKDRKMDVICNTLLIIIIKRQTLHLSFSPSSVPNYSSIHPSVSRFVCVFVCLLLHFSMIFAIDMKQRAKIRVESKRYIFALFSLLSHFSIAGWERVVKSKEEFTFRETESGQNIQMDEFGNGFFFIFVNVHHPEKRRCERRKRTKKLRRKKCLKQKIFPLFSCLFLVRRPCFLPPSLSLLIMQRNGFVSASSTRSMTDFSSSF